MPVLAALVAGNFVECFVAVRFAVRHWVQSILVLCVRHEILAQFDWLTVPLFGGNLAAHIYFVAYFAAEVASYHDLLRRLVVLLHWSRQLEPWMCLLAGLTRWTKSRKVIYAKDSSHVSVPATRSVSAESTVIPRTVFYFRLWVDVKEWTLFIVTGVESGVEVAFRHFGHVILVQKLALITLFAEAAQPVFANNSFVAADVSKWTGRGLDTLRSYVKVANSCSRFVHAGERQRLSPELI